MSFHSNIRPINLALRKRIELDNILGAVNTWDNGYSSASLPFNKADLLSLYADASYPYPDEHSFLDAVTQKFPGCSIVHNALKDCILVRLPNEIKNEVLVQLTAIQAIAFFKPTVPDR